MAIDITQFQQLFFEETIEGLQLMESELLRLREGAADAETINTIFRAAHSIKGGSGVLGFAGIGGFTHHVETLLDEVRHGERQVTDQAIELLLRSVDCLRTMIEAARAGREVDPQQIEAIERELESLHCAPAPEPAAAPAESIGPAWKIHFAPHAAMLQTGNDPIRLFRELETLGELTVEAHSEGLPDFAHLDPEQCYLSWDLTLSGQVAESVLRDVFAWVDGDCDLDISPVTASAAAASEPAPVASPAEPAALPTFERRSGADRRDGHDRRTAPDTSSVRVNIQKIDALINMVGELVITQAMLSQLGADFDIKQLDKLRDGLDQLERNTQSLQESVLSIRMLPASFAFNRFPRLVHDLSAKLGKKVDLKISGEQTELDKTVLEKIGDPLVHLLRNAIDHGIECPEERVRNGKPETGTIGLNAFHHAGKIVVEVRDDGHGLDKDKLLAKARSCGLIAEGEQPTDEQIFNLIFLPGVTTAATVSDVSGRGVGMDVVRRNVKEIGGFIEVLSEAGRGTVFTIRLPLTLAILDGQLLRIGQQRCIIPLNSIYESVQIEPAKVRRVAGKWELYQLRGGNIPMIHLRQVFAEAALDDGPGLMVIVEDEGQPVGLVVDELLGQQQVVIKSLETNFKRVDGVSGATILGDGTVALILDIPSLVALAEKKLKQATA